jgi:valyl-tRNA synthetase
MDSSFEKFFEHRDREPAIYAQWEEANVFSPESGRDQSLPLFSDCLPPPNANGELHLGHSFGYTVMDALARFYRLRGHPVLLVPGKDHAGIQTQWVFEARLRNEGGEPSSAPREKLFEECYKFCTDRAHYMQNQEKALGLSADWSKELFTLDHRLSDIIYDTFIKMYHDGLIYRGTRIINWSVLAQTGISDVEVEYVERKGTLWTIFYPFPGVDITTLPEGAEPVSGEHGLAIATTRPETMLGDVALAVHPEDARYQSLIGREIQLPLTSRTISIIADSRVDKDFGTGVVKITPAHDFLDYEIGATHHLPAVQVIGKDGRMTNEAGAPFIGLSTQECRQRVLEQLESLKLLRKITPITHKVPIGERSKDVIEPLLSEQWFLAVDKPGHSIRERALSFLREGKVRVYPARMSTLFEQWLEKLRDWNISRQLWWGHRLPVWYRTGTNRSEIHVGKTAPEPIGWEQETDTFDTWFSSGQWAFSTLATHGMLDLDSPRESSVFPSHTMVMGRDILFFWACRMLLLTAYRLDNIPWQNIYFHGLILDEKGQKMSKSKGNGINPIDALEQHGADALRLALLIGTAQGQDIPFSLRKVEGYAKFTNKLWNAAKLISTKLADIPESDPAYRCPYDLALSRWIVERLHRTHAEVTKRFLDYEIPLACDELYSFTWFTFCDWYLEGMKLLIEQGTASHREEVAYVARTTLRAVLTMFHPVAPFVTEEIYQKLFADRGEAARSGGASEAGPHRADLLALAPWDRLPEAPTSSGDSEIAECIEVVETIRAIKAALRIPHQVIDVSLERALTDEQRILISGLARVNFVERQAIPSERALCKPYSKGEIVCNVENKELYRAQLEKDLAAAETLVIQLEKKLSGGFASHADPVLVAKERERLADSERMIASLRSELIGSN